MLEYSALFFGIGANLIIGLFVLAKNYKNKLNQSLVAITAATSLWQLANFYADRLSNLTLFWNKLTFLGPALVALSLFYFVKYLIGLRYSFMKTCMAFVSTGIITALIFSPYVVKNIMPRMVNGEISGINITRGSAYPLFVLWILAFITILILRIYTSFRNAVGLKRTQLRYVLAGIILSVATAITTNIILPLALDSSVSTKFAPLTTLFLTVSFSIAIVRHRLFDIRLIVARSVAYILSLGVIIGGYALSLALLGILLGQVGPSARQTFAVIIIIFLGLTYQPLKRSFDKVTNKIFYRDAYDAQEFLDRLNKILVSTIDLRPLLLKTSRIIRDTLKSEFCVFGVTETDSHTRRIVGTIETRFDEKDISAVRAYTPQTKNKLIVTDDIPDEHVEVREILRRGNIAVVARLTNQPTKGDEGLGYLVLADKRSGNPYSRQDLRIIEIITDELVIAVQNALRFEEIENFNIKLQEEVTRATKELRITNDRLRELDQTKDDFISMASHQLRTPLTSVKGYVSMVLEGDAGKIKPMQHKLLEQAFISSQRMVYLIADLLNVSRLRTGKFIIEPVPTDLSEVIEGEVAQLRDIAKARGLSLAYNRPQQFPALMLDEAKIRQVIMNFTDNAIYYTPAGGHITLNLRDKPDSVEFTVEDTGIGVPKNEQHRLFTKFYRAANAKKARPDGTGLGLFMAKKVVAAQGGAIIFSSNEGKGSTFGFTFPKAKLLTTEPPRYHGKTHLSV